MIGLLNELVEKETQGGSKNKLTEMYDTGTHSLIVIHLGDETL
jgi:hypothetical protein